MVGLLCVVTLTGGVERRAMAHHQSDHVYCHWHFPRFCITTTSLYMVSDALLVGIKDIAYI